MGSLNLKAGEYRINTKTGQLTGEGVMIQGVFEQSVLTFKCDSIVTSTGANIWVVGHGVLILMVSDSKMVIGGDIHLDGAGYMGGNGVGGAIGGGGGSGGIIEIDAKTSLSIRDKNSLCVAGGRGGSGAGCPPTPNAGKNGSKGLLKSINFYDDLFMRDSLNDMGTIPSPDRSVCYSPDIIPVGKGPLANPLALIENDWNRQVGQDILQGYNNYIYARGKNLAPNKAEGNIYLYYAPSSILLRPQDWKYNSIPSSAKDQPVFKAEIHGQRVLADNTFLWQAPPQPSGWHYCLISQVVTDAHPNKIPDSFQSSGAFVDWVRNNPAIAWRNIFIQKPDTQPSKTYLYNFGNLDSFDEKYGIRAACYGLPAKTKVSLSCGATGPYPQINVTQNLQGEAEEFVYTESILSPDFEGKLVVTITLPKGTPWPKGATVKISCLKIVGGSQLKAAQQHNHQLLALHAQPASFFKLTKQHTQAEQLVQLGDAQIIFY
ncbi:MAG: hypothetical protein ACC651_02125 [Candidatus Scalindua sp.]